MTALIQTVTANNPFVASKWREPKRNAAGQYREAIETYMLNPFVEFDDIISLALVYLKKGLLQESAK
ncbi:hypothetical protein chiPu_0026870, partial [Chiloscyllium punctatum]|nr:hypothetical protein [Chiloscyllium punctatum]